MSIANKVIDSKYLSHTVTKGNDERRRITRRWLVEAPHTTAAVIEEMLFQPPGTADGVYSGDLAYPPKEERIYENAYLVAQEVGPRQTNSVDVAQYVLVKTYDEATDELTLLESGDGTGASFRRDENNRQWMILRYIIRTAAWDTGSHQAESGVTQPGSNDPGHGDNYYLNSETVDRGAVLTVVTREFALVTEEPVQLGKTDLIRGPDNLNRYRVTLYQLASGVEPLGDIGEDTLSGTGAVLFSQQSEATDVVRQIVREYLVPGIVSTSTQFRNQGKLELQTVRAFLLEVDTPEGFTLVSTSEENPDGYTITSYNFAKGSGRVSFRESRSNNGRLIRTAITYLNEDSESGEYGIMVDSSVDERDGHTVHSETYVAGEGLISTESVFRNQGALRLVTRRQLSPADDDPVDPAAPDPSIGGAVVVVSRSHQEAEGHHVVTVRWAEGSGIISRSENTRDGIRIVELRSLGEPPLNLLGSGEVAGILLQNDSRDEEGVTVYRQVFSQVWGGSDWVEPAAGAVLDEWKETRQFTVPGLIAWSSADGYSGRPPTTQTLVATVTATLEDSDDIAESIWTVKSFALASWRYTRKEINVDGSTIPAQRITGSKSFRGYLGTGGGSITNGQYKGVDIVAGVFTHDSDPAAPPYGQEIIVEVSVRPLFTAADGTRWYRKVVVKLTPLEPFA